MFKKLSKNFSSLVIGEHNGKTLSQSTLKVIKAAQQFNEDIDLFVSGHQTKDILNSIKQKDQCKKVYYIDHPSFEYNTSDVLCQQIQQLVKQNNYNQVLAASSSLGKDIIPRLSAQFDSQAMTNILSIKSNDTFLRPIYADSAITLVKSLDKIKFMTIRTTCFDPVTNDLEGQECIQIDIDQIEKQVTCINQNLSNDEKIDLSAAKIVVSGGRALKSKENFEILEKLAQVLGNAAVGASRAAVDAGYVSNDLQIGQTGKVVAPELYFAFGISGAIQHVAGMKDSKIIVAVNKDADCAMFKIANYSLVGDLFEVIPELTQKLQE